MSSDKKILIDQQEANRAAILRTLQAPNPAYNCSLKKARSLAAVLLSLNFPVSGIYINPLVEGMIVAEFLNEEQADALAIDPDFPLYIQLRIGTSFHCAAMVAKLFDNGVTVDAVIKLRDEVALNDTRSPAEVLLDVPAVGQATKLALATIGKQLAA
jgi:hypothetical protein